MTAPTPDLESSNTRALGAIYSALLFEQLKAYEVADRLAELFQQGLLPVAPEGAAHALLTEWTLVRLSPSAEERSCLYAEVLGHPGGTGDDGEPNREFTELWLRLITAVRSLPHPPAIDPALGEPVRSQLEVLRRLLAVPEIASACTARDLGPLLERITAFEREVRATPTRLLSASRVFNLLPQPAQETIARDTSVAADLIAAVDFPNFVASLIAGVFDAIVTTSIEQMEAYAQLVAAVAASVHDFLNDTITENEMRDHLADQFPDLLGPAYGQASEAGIADVLIRGIQRVVGYRDLER